jgi:hypothetical protein
MFPREFFHIATFGERDAIDNYFLGFCERSGIPFPGPASGSATFARWRTLLAECYKSYRVGRYLICIPALITILEGAIALREGAPFIPDRDREAFFRSRIAACGDDMLSQAFWESVYVFVSCLFQFADFDGTRPPTLNRHWILHGRDIADWRQADALRLFQALDTIDLIFEFNLPWKADGCGSLPLQSSINLLGSHGTAKRSF